MENGDLVLVRTYSAGIHYGILQNRNGKEVTLMKSRRIWYWYGALSLNEIAQIGVDLDKSKISVAVDCITLTEVIEILSINSGSNLPL